MNIRDIAVLAEVSTATVSRVINGDPHVSDETRAKVMEVVELTGYRPNLAGKALYAPKRNKVLVLLPTIQNPYYSRMLQGVEQSASFHGFDTLVAITHRDPEVEKRYFSLAATNQVCGVITFTYASTDEEILNYNKEFPIVQCGASSSTVSCACIDNIQASYEATKYLIALGNKRIAFFKGPYGRPYEIERESGYRYAMMDSGLAIRREYILPCEYTYTDGFNCCNELMNLPEPPTAIFALFDIAAAGAIKKLLKLGYVPGKDIDVMGFDGTFISGMCSPDITSIEQPGYELGKAAFSLLLEKIEHPETAIKKLVMAHKLLIHESTRPMPITNAASMIEPTK